MTNSWLQLMQRGWRKPPAVVAVRAWQEVRKQIDRSQLPWRTGGMTLQRLLRNLEASTLDDLWMLLGRRPFAANLNVDVRTLEEISPDATASILQAARRACDRRVDLLGTGDIALGTPVDWQRDFKTGQVWPTDYFSRLDCQNLDQPSDVKIPWEISRLQWLIPVGQAYLLTRDERYAETVRDILNDWIDQNPCLYGVNWACTMEAAMRTFVWTWLFHVFRDSSAWRDAEFRGKFLTALYSHGEFTDRYLELSDVNGNHCTADAAALVFAGLFFGTGPVAQRWRRRGWRLLSKELVRQTTADGVDFEGSVPYHRLVTELFLWPALYRLRAGRTVSLAYQERLQKMAAFATAYTRPDGSAPHWGDGDDARVLPFSERSLSDHRYLPAIVGLEFGHVELGRENPGPVDEAYWMFGTEAARTARSWWSAPRTPRRSSAFPDGGYYVLQNAADHVFVDCGPVGQGGRGGHGHNDCLSFEAVLDGVRLIVDPGSFVYTASFVERNRFRSTAFHNTPGVDGEELNRFHSPRHLWTLRNDARPIVEHVRFGDDRDEFLGGHTGYLRLNDPVQVRRRFTLEHGPHRLQIQDTFVAAAEHAVEIPLHLAPGVSAQQTGAAELRLHAEERSFRLTWAAPDRWEFHRSATWISPSYGCRIPSVRLVWRRTGACRPFTMTIEPWENQSRWSFDAERGAG